MMYGINHICESGKVLGSIPDEAQNFFPATQDNCFRCFGTAMIILLALTLSLLSSKSTFSKPFKRKCISEVARIVSIIIFHLSKLWKAKFSKLCDVIFLLMLLGKFDIDHS